MGRLSLLAKNKIAFTSFTLDSHASCNLRKKNTCGVGGLALLEIKGLDTPSLTFDLHISYKLEI